MTAAPAVQWEAVGLAIETVRLAMALTLVGLLALRLRAAATRDE
jgi:hypothetical protein